MPPPNALWRCPAARALSLSLQVAETCQLAVRRLEWLQENKQESGHSPYMSVDPAPPAEETDVAKLRETLLDESRSLFDRYRAMFALRNLGGRAAVLALADGKGWPGAARSPLVISLGGLIQDWPVPNPGLLELQGCSRLFRHLPLELLSPCLLTRAPSQSARWSPVFHSPLPISVGPGGLGTVC